MKNSKRKDYGSETPIQDGFISAIVVILFAAMVLSWLVSI